MPERTNEKLSSFDQQRLVEVNKALISLLDELEVQMNKLNVVTRELVGQFTKIREEMEDQQYP